VAQGADRQFESCYSIYIHGLGHSNETSELATPQQQRTEAPPQASSYERRQTPQTGAQEPLDSYWANMIP